MTSAGFGIGAYSLGEAGSLLSVAPSTIRRWLFGYAYDHHGPRTEQAPLWAPQYGVKQDEPLLGFRDLIEARIVRGLREMGIGLPTIRACLRHASELVNDAHPFSTRQFKSDRRTIFLEQMDVSGGVHLLDLKQRQYAFRHVVEPTLIDLDFDTDAASRWWLLPKKRTIVLDPARSFGQPIVAAAGVPTARLAQVVAAEGSIRSAALLFDLSETLVRDALAYEKLRTNKHAV